MKKLTYFIGIALMFSCTMQTKKKNLTTKIIPNPKLQILAPEKQYFQIDPSESHRIKTRENSAIGIKENSFILPDDYKKGEKIHLILQEAITSIDLLGIGINLIDESSFLESSGMINIDAYYNNQQLRLKENLTLTMNNYSRKDYDFNVYKLVENQWSLAGKNQRAYAPESEGLGESERIGRSIRLYPSIDNLTWWNFDYPKPGIMCIKGKFSGIVADKDNIVNISTIGIGSLGFYMKWTSDNYFEIKSPINSYIRIIISDSKGALGLSQNITTWDKSGFNYSKDPKNSCQDIGTINVKNYPEEFWEDRKTVTN